MSNTILVSTRKGLFTVNRGRSGWAVSNGDFVGDNVTLTLHDPRDGADYAALNHGHFGIKLHHAIDLGVGDRWTRRAGRDLVRHHAGRPVPFARPGHDLGDDRNLVAHAGPQQMDGWGSGYSGHSFHLR